MANLREIQAQFSAALRAGTDFSSGILAARPCPSSRGLGVYQNNYRGNLHDTLVLVYPVIHRLVGADFFRYLARHFIAQYPATSGNLHHYGADMSLFLSGFEAVRQIAYLPDMASLEWAYHRAYYAPDSLPLDVLSLSQVAPDNFENISLQAAADCSFMDSRFPIYAIWKIHQDGQEARLSEVNLDTGAEPLLIFRPHGEVEVRPLQPALFAGLSALASGLPLGAVCDDMACKNAAVTLDEVLGYAIAEKVFTNFSVDSDR